MNEIRKNNEIEKDIVTAKFVLPKAIKIIFTVLICIFALGAVSDMISCYNEEETLFSGFSFAVTVVLCLLFILCNKKVKSWTCTITDKRIKGVIGIIQKKEFSYRLDMIDNVEIMNFLGVDSLKINFSQGKRSSTVVVVNSLNGNNTAQNSFSIAWISNIKQVYDAITELLTSIKNEMDVEVDIEMKKIDIEEKKMEAFSELVKNIGSNSSSGEGNNDFISQLERLNKLKMEGILTEEEFEKKKKELL